MSPSLFLTQVTRPGKTVMGAAVAPRISMLLQSMFDAPLTPPAREPINTTASACTSII